MGKALSGGSGWVILAWSARLGRCINLWAADHRQSLAGSTPLLAFDMYEHAYHLDFGPKVDAFMSNIDWNHVEARYTQTLSPHAGGVIEGADVASGSSNLSAVELHQRLAQGEDHAPLVLDVRLPDAPWYDMSTIDECSAELPKDREIVVYCMYGFWVSLDTAADLRERGFDAKILDGGISAWRAMGYATEAL